MRLLRSHTPFTLSAALLPQKLSVHALTFVRADPHKLHYFFPVFSRLSCTARVLITAMAKSQSFLSISQYIADVRSLLHKYSAVSFHCVGTG